MAFRNDRKRLVLGDINGPHIILDPDQESIQIFDTNGNLIINIDGGDQQIEMFRANGDLMGRWSNDDFRLIGTAGEEMRFDVTTVNPQIEFYSDNGASKAFINQPSSDVARASIGINSGGYTPVDGVARTIRLYLSSSASPFEAGRLEVINQVTQAIKGGYAHVKDTYGRFGYQDVAAGIHSQVFIDATQVNLDTPGLIDMDATGIINAQSGDTTFWQSGNQLQFRAVNDIFFIKNGVTFFQSNGVGGSTFDNGMVLQTGTFQMPGGRRARLLVGSLDGRATAAGLTTTATPTLIPGATFAVTPLQSAVIQVNGTMGCRCTVLDAGTVIVGQLFVNGVAQTGQMLFQTPTAPARATVAQSWTVPVAAGVATTFELRASKTGGGGAGTYTVDGLHSAILGSHYE